MKYKIIVILLVATLVMPTALECSAVSTSAEASVLIDGNTNEILYSHNADTRLPMASTTKIMTALVAIEKGDMNSTVKITDEMIGAEGSSIYLKAGESFTLKELLYALMLQSANDAAEAIAYHIGGSIEGFCCLMNEKAAELGLSNTNYTNPHGLDDELHYTTAAELAYLASYALNNPVFFEIVSTFKYTIPSNELHTVRYLVNHNKMLSLYSDSIGVKTGYTKRSGRCLVSAAEKNGVRIISVTLNCPDDWRDHTSLLDYGFSLYKPTVICEANALKFELPVLFGEKSRVTVANKEGLEIYLRDNESVACRIYSNAGKYQIGNIKIGDALCDAIFYLNGKEIAKIPLYAMNME